MFSRVIERAGGREHIRRGAGGSVRPHHSSCMIYYIMHSIILHEFLIGSTQYLLTLKAHA